MDPSPQPDPPLALVVSRDGLAIVTVARNAIGEWPVLIRFEDGAAVRKSGSAQPMLYERVIL